MKKKGLHVLKIFCFRILEISIFTFCKTLTLKISTNLRNKHEMVTLPITHTTLELTPGVGDFF